VSKAELTEDTVRAAADATERGALRNLPPLMWVMFFYAEAFLLLPRSVLRLRFAQQSQLEQEFAMNQVLWCSCGHG
jgi:ABC-type amino acid transport system permease subunit